MLNTNKSEKDVLYTLLPAPAAHFIKTVEDLYEALVQSSTALKFGIAFNEASPGYEAMPGESCC